MKNIIIVTICLAFTAFGCNELASIREGVYDPCITSSGSGGNGGAGGAVDCGTSTSSSSSTGN